MLSVMGMYQSHYPRVMRYGIHSCHNSNLDFVTQYVIYDFLDFFIIVLYMSYLMTLSPCPLRLGFRLWVSAVSVGMPHESLCVCICLQPYLCVSICVYSCISVCSCVDGCSSANSPTSYLMFLYVSL
jgi:hypothetical protein